MKSFSLHNFKSFAEEQSIPLKPITLIYGANSAGKSSIIQGYILLNYIMRTAICDPKLIETTWDQLDLGGFAQYSYKHKYNDETQISIELDDEVQLNLTIKAETNDFSQLIGTSAFLSKVEIFVDKKSIVKFSKVSPDNNVKYIISSLNAEHSIEKDIRDIRFDLNRFVHGNTLESYDENLAKGCFSSIGETTDIQRSVEDFLSEFLNIVWKPVRHLNASEMINGGRLGVTYIGPLRDYPPRVISNDQSSDDLKDHTWSILLRDSDVREKVNQWFGNSSFMNPTYRFEVQQKLDLQDLILPLLEKFKEVDVSNGYIPDELKSIASIEMYEEEPHLSLDNYSEKGADQLLKAILVNNDEKSIYKKLNLIDQRSQISVSLRDVGVGISQVLPVLVNAYTKENKIVAIEQPEIHLHPKLQAELADVFINTAIGEEKKSYLIETHSEHLLLRIMRRIRETMNGSLPEGITPITSSDVQILFVMPGQNNKGSVIKKIALDAEGEMIDNWPGGFFEESFNERFGI